MNKRKITFVLFFFILSCSNIEFVLNDKIQNNPLKDKVSLFISGDSEGLFSRELYSFFGNTNNQTYILKTTFFEKKENVIVKTNQAAEKIDYSLQVNYNLFYKTSECKILSKKIKTRFFFTPKSAGYNFGADRSFDKLYRNNVRENIQNFINMAPFDKVCL